jgi:fluoroacetyl-CoA thioesterase
VGFRVSGHDGIDRIGGGEHERFVVKWEKFNAGVAEKAKRAKALVGAA